MMTAPFGPHPGGMQAGLPHAHPGMPPGGGQPMGHPMPINPGVSGPNPHMAQTAGMLGMQPGGGGMPGGMAGQTPGGGMGMPGQNMGGPNAMAMSHLTPQQQMIQQQRQQQAMQQMSPAVMQQQRQLMIQQQQMLQVANQQQQQQQQQHMNMGLGPGQAAHLSGMNPAQIAQMQNNPAFHGPNALPASQIMQLQAMRQQSHLLSQQQQQQQQAQQQAHIHAQQQAQQQAHQQQQQQQQQQQAAQQQQQQASLPQQTPQPQPQQPPPQPGQQQAQQQPQPQPQQGQPGPGMTPNQAQNMAAHQIAMQHQHSQASNHSQQGPPQQPSTVQQAKPQPQSQVPGPAEGQSQGQAPQPTQQQGTPQQAQPGQQANQQQVNANAQQLSHQAAMQRQAMTANLLRQQQMNRTQTQGSFILKLVLFADNLSSFNLGKRSNDLDYWRNFVSKFFSPEGKLIQQVWQPADGGKTKEYAIVAPSLARWYWMHFESGVQNLQLKVENAKEMPLPNNGGHYVAFEKAQFTFWFENGTQLIWTGKLSATFPPNSDKIDVLEFEISRHDEYLPKAALEKILSEGSPVANRSPKMTKNASKQKMQQKMQGTSGLTMKDFPTAPVNEFGLTPQVLQYLEIAETMFFMQDLMAHSQEKSLRPIDAVRSYTANSDEPTSNPQQTPGMQPQQQLQQNQMQMNMQRAGNGPFPMGNRTPMQPHMQLPPGQQPNYSPAMSHMGIPMNHLNGPMPMNGSPHIAHQQGLPGGLMPNHNLNLGPTHTPSPHQSNMAAPPMIPQHSQQGTNSSAASANTSPNTAQKRRRSQVKAESDDIGDGNGGPRVKASPRVGGNKKVKQ